MSSSAVYSSQAATLNVARREIRERAKPSYEALSGLVNTIFQPITTKIAQKGKIRRGELAGPVREMIRRLAESESVVDLRFVSDTHKLSAREEYEVRFIQTRAFQEIADWMDFIACKIIITRNSFEIIASETGFSVNAHVLQRYMQCEYRPIKTFYEDIIRPLRMAWPFGIGASSGRLPRNDLALPFSGGLLLGEVKLYKERPTGFRWFVHGRTGPEAPEEFSADHVHEGFIMAFEMKTFVGQNSLFDGNDRLAAVLHDYADRHRAALDTAMETFVFDDAYGSMSGIKAAMEEASEILMGDEWAQYLRKREEAEARG